MVALTVVVVGLAFRSVLLALATAAMNLLSAGVAFGVLVLVFQQHWAEGLLGFHSTGAVINWVPLFTFAILFGLSMDYHVFVLSQVREAAQTGMPVRDVVQAGLLRSAGTVTSAAIVMVSVFSIFASLHMIEMKELGLGLAIAVLIDAVVVRVIVLPSVLMLLGRWAWWPGRIPAPGTAPDPALAPFDRTARELVEAALVGAERHRAVHLARAVEQGHLTHALLGELVPVLAQPAFRRRPGWCGRGSTGCSAPSPSTDSSRQVQLTARS